MPASSITVNGQQTRRPGPYSQNDTSALAAGNAQSQGVIALVGSFERGIPKVPMVFETSQALKRALPDSGALLSTLLFNPAKDVNISGGAQKVIIVRADPATQGVANFINALGGAAIIAKSRDYGSYANRIAVKIEDGTTTGHKVTTAFDGVTKVHDNIGGTKAFNVTYTGLEATTMVMTVDPTADPRILIAYTKTGLAGDADYVPAMMVFDGRITFTLSVAAPAGGSTFTITGLASDGSATETVSIAEDQTTAQSAKTWISVTKIAPANLVAESTFGIAGNAFVINRESHRYLQQIVDLINGSSEQGFEASVVTTANASTFDVQDLDGLTDEDITGDGNGPNADLWALVRAINRDSAVIVFERATGATAAPAHSSTATYLRGGSNGTPSTEVDWPAALNALKGQFCNSVQVLTDDAARHELLRQHLDYMAGLGGDERNAYVGVPVDTSFADTKTKIAALNNRNMCLVAQEAQIYGPSGDTIWIPPYMLAIMAAAMQAGCPVGTPLTWKYLNVLDFRQASDWTPTDNAEEALEKGLMFLSRDNVGIKWERSITTYLQDDNPFYTEMSSNESINESAKDLRRYLNSEIGKAGEAGTAASIKGLADSRLDLQADPTALNLIKTWNRKSLSVEDLGDTFAVSYEVNGKEPVNFIIITQRLVRIPSVA